MSETKKPSLAIVMFGLTKSLDITIETYKKHLFQILNDNTIPYSIFQHTYIFREPYVNAWSGEKAATYPNDKYLLLDAYKREVEYQEDVVKTIDFDAYYTHPTTWTGEVDPNLGKGMIRNMVLAYRSRKRAFQLLEPELDRFTHVLFIRPDLDISTDFDVDVLKYFYPNGCVMPYQDLFLGWNDKIIICEVEKAKHIGYLFDSLLQYSKHKQVVSETFLQDMLSIYEFRPCLISWKYELHRI
jgi:hypothetical protein